MLDFWIFLRGPCPRWDLFPFVFFRLCMCSVAVREEIFSDRKGFLDFLGIVITGLFTTSSPFSSSVPSLLPMGLVSPSWRAPERSKSLMVVTVTMWFGWSMFTDSVRDVTKCSSSSASSGETRNPALQSAQLFTRYTHLFLLCCAGQGQHSAFAHRDKEQRGLAASLEGKLLLPTEGTR